MRADHNFIPGPSVAQVLTPPHRAQTAAKKHVLTNIHTPCGCYPLPLVSRQAEGEGTRMKNLPHKRPWT